MVRQSHTWPACTTSGGTGTKRWGRRTCGFPTPIKNQIAARLGLDSESAVIAADQVAHLRPANRVTPRGCSACMNVFHTARCSGHATGAISRPRRCRSDRGTARAAGTGRSSRRAAGPATARRGADKVSLQHLEGLQAPGMLQLSAYIPEVEHLTDATARRAGSEGSDSVLSAAYTKRHALESQVDSLITDRVSCRRPLTRGPAYLPHRYLWRLSGFPAALVWLLQSD